MSVSLYRWTEECEQDPMCRGDCDLCRKETMEDKYNEIGIPAEVEADGFITRTETLERINESKARPAGKCIYPKCEECEKYHGHYCTVPMVVSKQIWLTTESLIARMENRLAKLETLVTDEIIGSKERRIILRGSNPMVNAQGEELNYTWDDYLRDTNYPDGENNK